MVIGGRCGRTSSPRPGKSCGSQLAGFVVAVALLAASAVASPALAADWVVNNDDAGYDPIPAGGTIVYSISVSNDAPVAAPATTLTLDISSGGEFTGGTGTITGCSPVPAPGPAVVTCNVPALAPNEEVSLSASVLTRVEGTVTVVASVPVAGDTQPANNTASQSTTVNAGADMSLALTGPLTAETGSIATYRFTATNLGPSPALGRTLTATLPEGLANIVTPPGCTLAASVLSCAIPGPVPAGGAVSFDLEAQIAAPSASVLSLTGTIAGGTPLDPISGNNTATILTDVEPGSDVRITKSVAPGNVFAIGEEAVFTLTPSFTGDTPTNLVITDSIPANYAIQSVTVSDPAWTCTVAGQLVTCSRATGGPPGANRPLGTITIATEVVSTGAATNIVNITSAGPTDPVPGNNQAQDGGVLIQDPIVDLRANKTGPNPAVVVEGQSFDFRISTTNVPRSNPRSAPFTGTIVMTDTIPAGLEVTGLTLNGWSCTPSPPVAGETDIVCRRSYTEAAPLAVNATTPAVVFATRATVTGSLVNRMEVTTENPNWPDNNLANNVVSVGIGSQGAAESADVQVVKSRALPVVAAGEVQAFTVDVINNGPNTATSVTVLDDLTGLINNAVGPTGAGFISATVSDATSPFSCSTATIPGSTTSRRLSCSIPSLPVCIAGVNCPTISILVRPGGSVLNKTNIASATSNLVADPNRANNSSTVSYTLDPRADVTVTKTASTSTPAAGQNLTYTITASTVADGRSAAENVTVTDTLPLDVTFISVTPQASCTTSLVPGAVTTSSNNQITCTLGTIPQGSVRAVDIVVRPNTGTRGQTLVNAASVTTSTPGDDPGNNDASASVTVANPSLDLLVNKTDTPDPTSVGGTTVYRVTVTNSGPSTAENVVVTDNLPSDGLVYLSHSIPSDGSCSVVPAVRAAGQTLVCSFPTLAEDESRVIEVTMEGILNGVFTNAVSVTSTEVAAGFDRNPGNNSVEERTTVRLRADVEVSSKTASAANVAVNVPFTYTIVVRNNTGTDPQTGAALGEALNVVLRDPLPAGMVVSGTPSAVVTSGTASSNNCTIDSGITGITCSFGTMSSGAEVTITLPATVTSFSGTSAFLLNTARVETESFDINLLNNEAVRQIAIIAPAIELTKRPGALNGFGDGLNAGDTLAYFFTVTNTGNRPLSSIVVSDPKVANIVCLATALAPGEFTFCSGDPYVLTEDDILAGEVLNTATVTGTTSSGSTVSDDDSSTTTLPGLARLGIAKVLSTHTDVDGNGFVSPGDALAYTITATNRGNTDLTNVVVSDTRITPDSASCAILRPAATCVLTGSLTVTPDEARAGEIVNTASADSTETAPVTASLTVPVRAATGGSSLTTTALVTTVKRGERVPYVIRASDVPLSPVRIVDIMPPGFNFVAGSATANGVAVAPVIDGNRLSFDGLTPDAEDGITLELTLLATSAAATGDNVNRAELVNPADGEVLAAARARVTLLEEAVFDCSDVIGKVFDDRNRSGYQDEGEPGLPGVRLATVKGLLVTTDPHGRFSIPCADIPDADIGTNFIVKLDPRTLPTGYALTTENPRKVRLTRGKMVKLNFGAAGDGVPEASDVQVTFDGLGVKPILNAATLSSRRSFAVGEEVIFLASSNYGAFIARQEIRIFATGRHAGAEPVAVVAVDASGRAVWVMPPAAETGGLDDFVYVLRAYDAQGRFDETRPLSLARRSALATAPEAEEGAAPGYSDDNTAFRNIPVEGGAITVAGQANGSAVTVLGEEIPVDAQGRFVVQRILPPGEHQVEVAVDRGDEAPLTFSRGVNIPASEWFYVGLADVTLGTGSGSKGIEDVKPGEFDGVYTRGRAAFYLKGKIKGRYLLTAAADTGEEKLQNMFKGLDEKDARSLLSRIDPDDYYAVYGDDSASVEDAPTQGKFYVRLERGESRVLWGNFKTDIRGTEFLRNDRGLYGGNLVLKSDRMVASGERAGELNAYAAQPGTLPQRDVMRGTGGSAYFLRHQDITIGSESVYVELRNPVTGQVISRRQLRYGHDYSIDYLQGTILLDKPLSSSLADGSVVSDGALGGNQQYLVVAYEYTPAAGDVDGYVYGGRAQQWIGDHVRLGATGGIEKTGAADQTLVGADIQIYKSERTFIEGEVAQSEGPGFGFSESVNGGLTITDTTPVGAGQRAMAYRARARLDAADVLPGAKGDLQLSYAYKQKGFSTLDEQVDENRHEFGFRGDLALTEKVSLNAYGDQLIAGDDLSQWRGGAGVTVKLKEDLLLSAGAQHLMVDDREDDGDGQRTDAGIRLERLLGPDASVYVFGQATLDKSGDLSRNDRGGIGGTRALTDTVDASAEVSYGTKGFGGRALLSYEPAAATRYYIGYELDPDRSAKDDLLSGDGGQDLGGIVAGVRHGYSERLSVYAENKFDVWDEEPSLTQVYGVTYTPTPEWKLGGAIESGTIWGDSFDDGFEAGEFQRTALSLTAAYAPDERLNATIKGEVRFDDSDDNAKDLTAYYVAGRISHALNEDWRVVATLDAVLSDATESTRDGDYVEASLGYAYRPVLNDRLNMLLDYTFLYDLPGPDQVTVDGSTNGPMQRSNIFSVDAAYDLTEMLTLGGKYGIRLSETKPRSGGDWESANAQLAVIRADVHVVKNWDVLLEGRSLWETTGETADFGALAAIYRHLGENFEVGVGYNFGRYSDDLRDLTKDDQDFFINAVGKF